MPKCVAEFLLIAWPVPSLKAYYSHTHEARIILHIVYLQFLLNNVGCYVHSICLCECIL